MHNIEKDDLGIGSSCLYLPRAVMTSMIHCALLCTILEIEPRTLSTLGKPSTS